MPVLQELTEPELNDFGGDRYLPDIPKEWFVLPILKLQSQIGI